MVQKNPDWMLGYRDGAMCTHPHTPEYFAGVNAVCHDKKAGLLLEDENGFHAAENVTRYPTKQNDRVWQQGFEDGPSYTSYCPSPETK